MPKSNWKLRRRFTDPTRGGNRYWITNYLGQHERIFCGNLRGTFFPVEAIAAAGHNEILMRFLQHSKRNTATTHTLLDAPFCPKIWPKSGGEYYVWVWNYHCFNGTLMPENQGNFGQGFTTFSFYWLRVCSWATQTVNVFGPGTQKPLPRTEKRKYHWRNKSIANLNPFLFMCPDFVFAWVVLPMGSLLCLLYRLAEKQQQNLTQ